MQFPSELAMKRTRSGQSIANGSDEATEVLSQEKVPCNAPIPVTDERIRVEKVTRDPGFRTSKAEGSDESLLIPYISSCEADSVIRISQQKRNFNKL